MKICYKLIKRKKAIACFISICSLVERGGAQHIWKGKKLIVFAYLKPYIILAFRLYKYRLVSLNQHKIRFYISKGKFLHSEISTAGFQKHLPGIK